MSTYDRALKQLKSIHKKLQGHNIYTFEMTREKYNSMAIDEQNKWVQSFDFMEQEGWIKKCESETCAEIPYKYKLTSRGIKLAESHVEEFPVVSNTFNIGQNYGVTAANANDFTINQGISFTDIERLINERVADINEHKLIMDNLQLLKELIEDGKPINKGVLSLISSHLQKHSWLSSALAGKILQYLVE